MKPSKLVPLQNNNFPEKIKRINLQKDLRSINLDYLKYFVVLSKVQNFSKASDVLNITQQALSKAIITLENQVGTILIERDKQFKKLTNYGQLLLEKSEIIIQNIHEIQSCNFLIDEPNQLKISWVGPVGFYILPKLLKKFIDNYPVSYFKVFNLVSEENVEESILSGEYDIGFMTTEPKNNLSFKQLLKTSFVIVGNESIKKNWNALSYISSRNNKNSKNNNYFKGAWDETRYPRKIKIEVDTLITAIKLCQIGYGALYILSEAVNEELEKKKLYIISEPPFKQDIEIYMIWNENKPSKEILKNFLNEINLLGIILN